MHSSNIKSEGMEFPFTTKIQSIDLLVRDLKESFTFYSHLLGLKVVDRIGDTMLLSANGKEPYLIKLTEDVNAELSYRGAPGLFHLAIRFPNRKELARVFLRLFNNKTKFQGFADHLVSEAIYLSDPEGNGVELYVDRPRDEWDWKFGEVLMDTLPLDISLLTNELDDREVWNGIHPDADLGHVHLNVSDLSAGEKFYNEILGLNITSSSYPGARFFSAGGYHHHVGINIRSSKKGISRKKNSTGMTAYTLYLPGREIIKEIEIVAKNEGLFLGSENNKLVIKDYEDNKVILVG